MALLRSERELLEIGFNQLLAPQRLVNLARRDLALLCQRVGDHDHCLTREKIEHSVVHPSVARPELINATSQKVGLRPPHLVPQLPKTVDPLDAFGLDLRRQAFELL
jgi:hypothetical protein